MRTLTLTRDAYYETSTMGYLKMGAQVLYTVEQEWRPTAPGGEPNNSCVPEGRYELLPHVRPNEDEVFALVNEGLGVYYTAADRTRDVGRFLILIHAGNTSSDVTGCIAPGCGRHGEVVTRSREAMKKILQYIGDEPAEIIIRGS